MDGRDAISNSKRQVLEKANQGVAKVLFCPEWENMSQGLEDKEAWALQVVLELVLVTIFLSIWKK